MNPQSPEREALSARDRRWVAALQAHGPDGPPPALDAAVLAAARAAVGAPAATPSAPSGRGARPPRWLAAVAGVMVVVSAGVLVRQVAQETAPKEPSIAAPSSAAERRAESVRAETHEAEGGMAAAEAQTMDEVVEPAVVTGSRIRPESPVLSEAMPAAPSDSAPAVFPPPGSSVAPMLAPSAEALAPRLQAAPKSFAPPPPAESPASDVRARADAAPMLMQAPAAAEPVPAPLRQAETAPDEYQQESEVGQSAARSVVGAGLTLPETDVIAEVRRLLATGEREAARALLIDWRQRHPGVVLPAELEALLEQDSSPMPGGPGG